MNAVPLPDDVAQHRRFRRFIQWLVPLSWAFTVFYGTAYLLAPHRIIAILVGSCFVFSCLMLWARQLALHGQVTRAALTVCASFLGASLICALAVPAVPTMSVSGVLLAVVLLLMFGDGAAERAFLWRSYWLEFAPKSLRQW